MSVEVEVILDYIVNYIGHLYSAILCLKEANKNNKSLITKTILEIPMPSMYQPQHPVRCTHRMDEVSDRQEFLMVSPSAADAPRRGTSCNAGS